MSRNIYAAILWLALSGLAGAKTIYVATNGVDTRDGQNYWTNAVLTISNGVAKATTANDTVLVSNGTYLVTTQINVSAQITVDSWNNGVEDPTNTIVNGNGATRCFSITAAGAVVEGLTIYNGNGNGASGGGVNMTAGTLRNCIVVSNSTLNAAGGGINLTTGSLVDNCTIAYNNATNGGGVYFIGGLVTNCTIRNNSANSLGGPDYGGGGVEMKTAAILSDCRVYWNVAVGSPGGGILMYNVTSGVAKNCVISNNFTTGGSGAGASITTSTITNCVIITNICGGWGAGINQSGGTIANCQIIGNQVTNNANKGGGISGDGGVTILNSVIQGNYGGAQGGGIYANNNNSGMTVTMRNCLITGNVALNYGGGIYMRSNGTGYEVLENCTFVSNSVSSQGGGLYTETWGLFANCIFYYNTAVTAGSSNYWSYNFPNSVVNYSLSNCCFSPVLAGGATNYSTNNITFDPQFADKNAGNYRLKATSPCINSGVNRDWMTNAVDLDGRLRRDRFSGQVDMGCYERIPQGIMFFIR